MSDLSTELETYEKHRARLVGEALRKYVLISGADVLGTYDTESDAISDAYRRLGNVPFLVKRVAAVDEPANFVSGLVIA